MSKVLIQFLLNFRQSGDVLFFLYVRRLRGYTATISTQSMHVSSGHVLVMGVFMYNGAHYVFR